MKSGKFYLAFFLVCAVCLANLCRAESPAKKEFVIGVEYHEYQPYYGFDPANKENYIGYAREFLDAFASSRGYEFEYKMLPVKRLFAEFFSNNLDFKFPDNAAWSGSERIGKTIHYSDSVCDFVDGLMIKAENKGIGIDKIQEIGTVRGFTPWAFIDLINDNRIKLSEANSLPALLKQVESGRIDGAYGNITVSHFALKSAGIEENKMLFAEQLPQHKGSYLLSTMKHPEIIAELNSFLLEKKELINELRKKYHIKMFADQETASGTAAAE